MHTRASQRGGAIRIATLALRRVYAATGPPIEPLTPKSCMPPPRPGRLYRLRGGVSGRELPPKENFCFSAGLRMRKEHMSDSSMAMMAPALSNSPQ